MVQGDPNQTLHIQKAKKAITQKTCISEPMFGKAISEHNTKLLLFGQKISKVGNTDYMYLFHFQDISEYA